VIAAATVSHYDAHLEETYVWMCGGFQSAVRAGAEELAAWGIPGKAHDLVLDLGCGFGKHTIPLLAAGARVHAIDASRAMLEILRSKLPPLSDVRILRGEVLDVLDRASTRPDAILCLGDTLTHLPTPAAVERLLRTCATRLAPGGRLALSFRDYTEWRTGDSRRIDLRSDRQRRVHCTVTVLDHVVTVEDTVSEHGTRGPSVRSHVYQKLRLAPERVAELLQQCGAQVERLPDRAGMTRLLAHASA
jgi:2-polyprenyl-3-methyl-5-hydroxy-6-metoxy-1,4-benzoquinol methylase